MIYRAEIKWWVQGFVVKKSLMSCPPAERALNSSTTLLVRFNLSLLGWHGSGGVYWRWGCVARLVWGTVKIFGPSGCRCAEVFFSLACWCCRLGGPLMFLLPTLTWSDGMLGLIIFDLNLGFSQNILLQMEIKAWCCCCSLRKLTQLRLCIFINHNMPIWN